MNNQFKQQQETYYNKDTALILYHPFLTLKFISHRDQHLLDHDRTSRCFSVIQYSVDTPYGEMWRNRTHLNVVLDNQESSTTGSSSPDHQYLVAQSMNGTAMQLPERVRQQLKKGRCGVTDYNGLALCTYTIAYMIYIVLFRLCTCT